MYTVARLYRDGAWNDYYINDDGIERQIYYFDAQTRRFYFSFVSMLKFVILDNLLSFLLLFFMFMFSYYIVHVSYYEYSLNKCESNSIIVSCLITLVLFTVLVSFITSLIGLTVDFTGHFVEVNGEPSFYIFMKYYGKAWDIHQSKIQEKYTSDNSSNSSNSSNGSTIHCDFDQNHAQNKIFCGKNTTNDNNSESSNDYLVNSNDTKIDNEDSEIRDEDEIDSEIHDEDEIDSGIHDEDEIDSGIHDEYENIYNKNNDTTLLFLDNKPPSVYTSIASYKDNIFKFYHNRTLEQKYSIIRIDVSSPLVRLFFSLDPESVTFCYVTEYGSLYRITDIDMIHRRIHTCDGTCISVGNDEPSEKIFNLYCNRHGLSSAQTTSYRELFDCFKEFKAIF